MRLFPAQGFERSGETMFGDELKQADTGRICGHCQLCCTILPIYDLLNHRGEPKPWNTKCVHQRCGNKGCTVYNTTRPASCRAWACGWLKAPEAAEVQRPDKGHYIVDIYITHFEITEFGVFDAVQVWLDPKYPLAWRCPKLLTFLGKMAEENGYAATIRLRDKDDALLFFPPAINPAKGHWVFLDTRQGTANIRLQPLDLPKSMVSTLVSR